MPPVSIKFDKNGDDKPAQYAHHYTAKSDTHLHTKASGGNREVAQLGEMVPTSPGLVFPTRRLEKHSPGLVSLTPRTAQYETVAV